MKYVLAAVTVLLSYEMSLACTDFSGKWAGECETDGVPQPSTGVEVWKQEGCEKLIFDDHHVYSFDGIAVEGTQTPTHAISSSTSYNWNSDKTQIIFYSSYTKKSLSTPEAKTSVAQGPITLTNDEIDIRWTYDQVLVDAQGTKKLVQKLRTCHLTRQP